MITTNTTTWTPDILADCEATTINLPDSYDGPCVATLVRQRALRSTGRAVLYIHGFNDYFFQSHMAAAYSAQGYDFYALDLRRYGRSLRPHQRPNFCRDLSEYFTEIDRALELISAEGADWLLLNGHSTGGLISALYAHSGTYYDHIKALFLNSPFVELNAVGHEWRLAEVIERVGAFAPGMHVPGALSPLYAESIHRDYRGEWEFDPRWKPLAGFRPYAGWARAIRRGQRKLQAGLAIACPILLMHATRSHRGKQWSDEFTCTDCVLNIEHMRRYGPGLGRDVTLCAIEGGLHDLVLSAPPVRERVFAELFGWLEARP